QRERDNADQQHARHQQRRRDGPENERCGDTHGVARANSLTCATVPGFGASFTWVPASSLNWLLVTTRSPSCRPARTTATSPFSPSVCSLRTSTVLSAFTT